MLRKPKHFYQTTKSKFFVSQLITSSLLKHTGKTVATSNALVVSKRMTNWLASLLLTALFAFSMMSCQSEEIEVEPQQSIAKAQNSARSGCSVELPIYVNGIQNGILIRHLCLELYYYIDPDNGCVCPSEMNIKNIRDLLIQPDGLEINQVMTAIDRTTLVIQEYNAPLTDTYVLHSDMVLNQEIATDLGLQGNTIEAGLYKTHYNEEQQTWTTFLKVAGR